MTLSLYSTFKAWRRDVAAECGTAVQGPASATGIYPAFALFGMGLGGVSCGGDDGIAEQV